MNILFFELKRNFKSTTIWTIALSAMNALTMLMFPTVVAQSESLENILKQMPKELLVSFGMDKLSMTDIMGYYGTKQYTILLLFGAIYSTMLFSSILAREESEKTIEFLLSKPISRGEILNQKIFAGLILLVLFNLVITVVTWFSFEAVKKTEYNMRVFVLLALGLLIMSITFGAIGLLGSLFFKRGRSINSFSIAFVLGTYFLGVISTLSDKLENLRYLTPFKYVDAVDIISFGAIKTEYWLTLGATIVGCLLLSFYLFIRKDIFT